MAEVPPRPREELRGGRAVHVDVLGRVLVSAGPARADRCAKTALYREFPGTEACGEALRPSDPITKDRSAAPMKQEAVAERLSMNRRTVPVGPEHDVFHLRLRRPKARASASYLSSPLGIACASSGRYFSFRTSVSRTGSDA